MTVPFRSQGLDDLGTAAFVRLLPSDEANASDGSLFVINAVGEPVEFCFARAEMPRSILWRQDDLGRRVQAALVRSLFEACAATPLLVFAKADELDPAVLKIDVRPEIAACRVGASRSGDESDGAAGGPQLHWVERRPPEGSPERRLLLRLVERSLLVEPFERARLGLEEALARRLSPGMVNGA